MAAKLPSRTITSRRAANNCCAPAWSVLWPEPVWAASRQASSADAAATPMLMPQERITFRSPPASPVRDAGAAATTALLLGEMNNPWPIPKTASASITSGRLAAVPSSTAKSNTKAAAEPVVKRAGDRRHHAKHHRDDGKPQTRGECRIPVGAHEDEGHQKEQAEQRRVGHEAGDVAGGERALSEQREVDQRGVGASLGVNEQRQQDHRQQR